jgi:hypothetical protein
VTQTQSAEVSYLKKQVPDEFILRKNYLHACYQETIVNIRQEIGDSYIWVAVDETADVLGRFLVNLIAGKLDPEGPYKSLLIFFQSAETHKSINSCTIYERWTESVVASEFTGGKGAFVVFGRRSLHAKGRNCSEIVFIRI